MWGTLLNSIGRSLLIATTVLVAMIGALAPVAAEENAPFSVEALEVRNCRPRPDIFAAGSQPAPASLANLIDEHLADDRLDGAGLGLSIWIEGYGEVEAVAADLRLKPASNQKLLTAMAAFEILGADYRMQTQVATNGLLVNGVLDGDLYLIGGGDATLASENGHSLATLASEVRNLGVQHVTGRILGDESRYDDRREAAGWRDLNIPESMGSLSALLVDENRYRADWPFIEDPTPYNAAAFAAALRDAGVVVDGVAAEGVAPPNAAALTRLLSPPVDELVGVMLTDSHNMIAEMLTKEMGLVTAGVGSTVAGVAAMREVVRSFCLPTSVLQHDGSGLSHYNARSTRGWRALLQAAQDRPWWSQFVAGLAIACETGTLERRFVETAAAGNLRAKTGTISGIRALSGIMETAGGRTVFFSAVVDDDRNPRAAMRAIDDLLVAIAEDES